MKYLVSQLAYLLAAPELRRNLGELLRYIALLTVITVLFTVLFHVIMVYEGKDHSWLTGLYWVLTVMSTLGFGDITFTSDLGRFFTIAVLLTGLIMLLIVLPFAFIRLFYAPWLEAQVHTRAPRKLDPETRNHLIICADDPVTRDLTSRLDLARISYWIVEANSATAAEMHGQGVPVVLGDIESTATWSALRVDQARAVIANVSDPRNTNVTLTLREIAPKVPVISTAEDDDAVAILGLAGATEVLPLKRRLGEQLANRVSGGHAEAHEIGRFKELVVAEFPLRNTPWVGKRIGEATVSQILGCSIVGLWERGKFVPARPDTVLGAGSVAVVVGTATQVDELNGALTIYNTNYHPVVVIGAGKVGLATTRALRRRDLKVHLVERASEITPSVEGCADRLIVGDAADREVLVEAGIEQAPAVILTTNDDSNNIYLAIYCRRLNPQLQIVSRITHERNLEAVHRAGADHVLSYASLGAESMFAALHGGGVMMLGAGMDLFPATVPQALVGKTLAESALGSDMNVIAVQTDTGLVTSPPPTLTLRRGGELLLLGTPAQRVEFARRFR